MPNLEYITVPISTNPDELAQIAFAKLIENIPGWEPNPGNFEVIVIEAIALMMSEARDVASIVPASIFRYFGQAIMKIQPIEALSATALTDWTFADNKGHIVPAGTPVTLKNAAGEIFGFQTLSEFSCPVGETVVKGIRIEALEPGEGSSGLKGTITLAANYLFVTSVALNAATPETTGGINEETNEAYLNRLAAELSLMAPRPITISDYALIAGNVPGVYRSLAINGFNSETGKTGEEKTVCLCPLDANGVGCSEPIRNALKKYIEERREVNAVITVTTPTITEVDVTITVHGKVGTNATILKESVESAIKQYLEGKNWGAGSAGTFPTWRNEEKVRRSAIATVANANAGIAYVELPEINKHGEAVKPEDYVLPGKAPLTKPGTITVTVVIP